MLTAPPAPPALPPLREDLQLFAAAPHADGAPAWMIQDPVSNRFFRIGWLEFELLKRWQSNAEQLLRQINQETPLHAEMDSLNALQAFLEQNFLLRCDQAEQSQRLSSIAAQRRKRDLKWLLHNYLFVRIPLVRPERFLQALLHYTGFIYTRWFALLMIALTLWGIVLASRQWDTFLVSFQDSFTPAGILAYMTALAFAKIMHEMGHALTATRYRVRVAHMGVSLVVMFPMLYTDTSESWKLTRRQDRLAIVSAGVITELGIAGLATLAWSLSSDGALRSAFFFLATTSWILTVAINASPFMRFDGYFLLSDALDFPNLHQRSFAFGRQRLRRFLLGWEEPVPEYLSLPMQRFLVCFAFIVWGIRFTVFLGIAVSVYLFFFKALGIFLFIVEILWFIVMPVWSELKVWWERRSEIRLNRIVLGGFLLCCLALFLFVPWKSAIHAPGWVRSAQTQTFYAPFAAQLNYLRPMGEVQAGDLLASFNAPDIDARQTQAQASSATVWAELQRSGIVEEEYARRALLSSRLRQEQAEGLGAIEELGRLDLFAPFAGQWQDIDPLLQTGVWVKPEQALGLLTAPNNWIAEAYATQEDLWRLQRGDHAKVYVTQQANPIPAQVLSIDSTRSLTLPDPMLDAAHGGQIRVSTVDNKQEVQQALYRVQLQLLSPPAQARSQTASVLLYGEKHSIAGNWLRYLGALLIRESGF